MLHLDKYSLIRVPPHFEEVKYESGRISGFVAPPHHDNHRGEHYGRA